jgi:hypothetical protein
MNNNRLELPKEIKLNNNVIDNKNIEYYINPLKKQINKKTKKTQNKFMYYMIIIIIIIIINT